ncbi:MAG: hypothetical protein KC442_14750, partial [Thermomicrobiales bacterium]|nr:hypothetical protein [Thermomicrobiales bacterium]
MVDDHTMASRVGEYWDALVLGQESIEPGLDESLEMAIRHFQAMGEEPPATARDRVWRTLAASGQHQSDRKGYPAMNVVALPGSRPPFASAAPSAVPPASRKLPYRTPALLAAMLIALLAGLGYRGLGPIEPRFANTPAMLTAIQPDATPATAGDGETLVVIPFTEEIATAE